MKKSLYTLFILLATSLAAKAQVGEHRNQYSVGVHGGLNLSSVTFQPKLNLKMKQGIEGGVMLRYTCEKYFKSICAIQAEVNYSQMGWEEDILDLQNNPVPSKENPEENEYYRRTINYVQIPILAHMRWGKEYDGFSFFFNAGPQLGYLLSEKTESNFTPQTGNVSLRANKITAQHTMEVEHKFDYGITAGLGLEYSLRRIGRLQIEARYYYGLGNLYGDTKRDYFGCSRLSNITLRAAYLYDL